MHLSALCYNSWMDFQLTQALPQFSVKFYFPLHKTLLKCSFLHVSRLTVQGCSPLKTVKTGTLEGSHVEFGLFFTHFVHSAGPGHAQPLAPTYPENNHEVSQAEQKGYHHKR